MSDLKCNRCKRMTNTSVSEFMDSWPYASQCYAAVDPKTGKWVKGCGYKTANKTNKFFSDRLIGRMASIQVSSSTDQTVDKSPKYIDKAPEENEEGVSE